MPEEEANSPQQTTNEAQPSSGGSPKPDIGRYIRKYVALFGVLAIIFGIIINFGSFLDALKTISSIFSYVKWWLALIISVGSLVIYCVLGKKRGFLPGDSILFQLIYGVLWGLMVLPWIPVVTPRVLPEKAAAERVHIALVIDSSARMKDSFQGSASKWEAALSATQQYLSRQSPEANYSVFVVGSGESNQSEVCSCPDTPLVPWGTGNRDLATDRISHLVPNGQGPLTTTLVQARDALLQAPFEDMKSVYIIVGGPDECDQDDHLEAGFDAWENLLDSIEDIFAPINVHTHTDLIALVSEDVKNDIEEKYRVRLRVLGVQLASNQEEIAEALEVDIQESKALYQYAIGTSTSVPTISGTAQRSPSPIPSITVVLPTQSVTPVTADSNPTSPPRPTATNTATCTPLPTSTRTLTPLPPTFTPTNTPTDTPTFTPTFTLAFTPTDYPENLLILAPNEGQDFNCLENEVCMIGVTIQWVPESQTNGRYLSIWVRPIPDDPYQSYFAQQTPSYIGNGRWQSDEVYIGQIGDSADTPFRIYALVTYELYSRDDVLPYLPASLMQDEVNVTR